MSITRFNKAYNAASFAVLASLPAVLCFHTLAFAADAVPAAAQQTTAPGGVAVTATPAPDTFGLATRMGLMFLMAYLIFHQFAIKPQKVKAQQQQALMDTIKRGDQVVTTGGMIAKVANVEKEYALLELAPNVKVKFELSHIAKRLDKPVAANS